MSITALPIPPTRSDPANFAERGDAFMSALPTFVTEANALAADVNAKQSQIQQLATETATTVTEAETASAASAQSAALDAGRAHDAATVAQLVMDTPITDTGLPLKTIALIYAAL